MMDLSTTYLGFKLPHPIMPGASPLVDDLDVVRRLVDAGAPMVVMHSLFEEQIRAEQVATARSLDWSEDSSPEATSYLPRPANFRLGPDEYLEQVRKIKVAVGGIPLVASLNGTTPGAWLKYAELIQQAGADALELNLYEMAMDENESSAAVEERASNIVHTVMLAVTIPVAVKLSPFYSSLSHFAARLDRLGVDGLVLFNRLYQPDIDVEQLEVRRVILSSPSELLLRLRWVAALHGKVRASLAVTGGVHTAIDVVKAVMAGADGVQMVSALLRNNPGHLRKVRDDLEAWMIEHEYASLAQMRGSMSQQRCPDPKAYERANYVQILQSWMAP